MVFKDKKLPEPLLLSPSSREAVTELKQQRNLDLIDKNLLSNIHKLEFDKIDFKKIDNVCFETDYQGVRFGCLYINQPGDYFYITLNGGRWRGPGDLATVPTFSRWSWSNMMDGPVLCIEDPMYYMYQELVVGWFYGTESVNYRNIVAQLIKDVANQLNVDYKKIIVYASSSGGSAALQVGSFIPGSTVVAINPQINLLKSGDCSGFIKNTSIDISNDKLGRTNGIRTIISSKLTKYIIICNVRSVEDYEKQIIPLCDEFSIKPISGVTHNNNLTLWLYDAPGSPSPHTAYDYRALFFGIDYLSKNLKNINNDTSLYMMFNQFIYDHHSLKYEYWSNKNKLIVTNGKDKRLLLERIKSNPYKRGFILSEFELDFDCTWAKNRIGNLYITYDVDNEFVYVSNNDGLWISILGHTIDTFNWIYGNTKEKLKSIASNLLDIVNDHDVLMDRIDYLSGRFIIIYSDGINNYLIQDASGLRSVYYHEEITILSSHYEIIHQLTGAAESIYWEKYQQMDKKPWVMMANLTPYEKIYSMVSNHEYNITKKTIKRIWPRKEIEPRSIRDVCGYIKETISKQIDLISSVNKLYIQITGGYDSRLMLALSKSSSSKITYYTYVSKKDPKTVFDFNSAVNLMKQFDLKYCSVDVDKNYLTPQEYEIFYNQMKKIHYHISIPRPVLACYFNLPDDAISIRSSLIELCRDSDNYNALGINETKEHVFNSMFKQYSNQDEVLYKQLFNQYYNLFEYDNIFDYRMGDILYLENRMQFWLSNCVINEEDWATKTFIPFNTRKIIEYCLSVSSSMKKQKILIDEIIKSSWYEVLWHVPNTNFYSHDLDDHNVNALAVDQISIYSGSINDNTRMPAFDKSISFKSFTFSFSEIPAVGDFILVDLGSFVIHNKKRIQIAVTCVGSVDSGLFKLSLISSGNVSSCVDISTIKTGTILLESDIGDEIFLRLDTLSNVSRKQSNFSLVITNVYCL